jgi:hypothetical protein
MSNGTSLRAADLTQMQAMNVQRELQERAQDKQAAVAIRGQDKQVEHNKAIIAADIIKAAKELRGDEHYEACATLCLEYLTKYFGQELIGTPAEWNVPEEIVVKA